MSIVREHINEKFVEDSDPIRDMGIGNIEYIFEKAISKMFELTTQKILTDKAQRIMRTPFQRISIDSPKLYIKLFSNTLYNDNKKIIKKLVFVKNLLKKVNLLVYLEKDTISRPYDDIPEDHYEFQYINWEFTFYIKPEYLKYFEYNKIYHYEPK